MAVAEKIRTEVVIVAPFGIEADHPRNCDLLLQSIPNVRLRSRLSASRTVEANPKDPYSKDTVIPKDQARHLGSLPEIPGMRIYVKPAELAYKILDPLEDDEALCDRLQRALETDERPVTRGGKIRGVPTQTGTLDRDRMKTLCRELFHLLDAGEAKMTDGPTPELDLIDDLPGDYLLNAGSTVMNTQPRYEKDLEGWVSKLNSLD